MEYYIGIDLGGTNIAAALVDGQGKILGRANLATGAGRPAAEIAADMAHAGRRAAEQAGVPIEQVSAVGMGVPGTANQKEGVLEFANNLGFLHEPIVEMMAGCFPGKQIWFDNDANAAAWGEYLAGGGRGADSMIAVTLGTGVGGGIILGGKLWNGVNYGAGELGHMVIDQNGPECNCGRRGCFEALASATALIRQTREAMDNAPKSLMWELCGGESGWRTAEPFLRRPAAETGPLPWWWSGISVIWRSESPTWSTSFSRRLSASAEASAWRELRC